MTALVDEFDVVRRWKKSSTLIVCCLLFLAGIPCTTQVSTFVYAHFLCGHDSN